MQSALSVYMGSEAAKTIGEQGWQAAPFSTLIGASGGPKWLILSELDKVLGHALLLDLTTAARIPLSGIQQREAFAH